MAVANRTAPKRERVARWVAVSAVAVCLSVIAVTALALGSPVVRARLGVVDEPATYVAGQRIDLQLARYGESPRTVIIFAREDCRACQSSRAVLAELVADLRSRRGVQVVLAFPHTVEPADATFAAEIGLRSDQVVGADFRHSLLRHVPAVAVVDSQSTILLFREGVMSDESRQEVLAAAS